MSKIPVKKAYAKTSKLQSDLKRWWLADDGQEHSHLLQLIKLIEENQKEQRYQDMRHAYLYNNHASTGSLLTPNASLPTRYNVTYNVVKSCVDTVAAKISQRELRPRVLTEEGNYTKQQRAKKLTKYLDGVLHSGEVYKEGPKILKDAGIFGTGVMKVLTDGDKVVFERTLIHELLVDDMEARYGSPQSMYQKRLVARDTLEEQFPEYATEISTAQSATNDKTGNSENQVVDMIEVFEGWHLGKHSRHIIAIEGLSLVNEDWEYDVFPFAFMRYQNKIDSFYGQGIAEELMGTQLEINKLLRDIQRAQHLIAVPRILVERHSKVITSQLDNESAGIWKYEGTKPDVLNPTAMNNEIYNHVKWLIQTSYQKVGVSELSATNQKPTGLDSKPALREYKASESERFAVTEMNYRDFFETVADLTIKWSKKLYANNGTAQIKAENARFIETIKWSDADLDDDLFSVRVYVSSMLPKSPAARLQKLEEMIRAGWMDRETAMQQMDSPDIEAWETLETADKQFVEKVVNDILEHGKYTAPEPEIDPIKAVNYARKSYLNARRTGAPEDKLELLLRWIEATASMIPDLAAPVTPDLGAGPTATPLPVPQSGILPQG